MNHFHEFREDMLWRLVGDLVRGIEAEAVDVKILHPIDRVAEKNLSHRPGPFAVHIEARAPRRLVSLCREIRAEKGEVVSIRAEVVINDVEDDRDSMRVRGVDQSPQ